MRIKVKERISSNNEKSSTDQLPSPAGTSEEKPAEIVVPKKRHFFLELTRDTIGNETAHAILKIFETKYLGLKLFWLCSLLSSSSLCFYLIIQTLLTYLSYPVYTTTTIMKEMPTVFPKVTICNSAFATSEYAYKLIKDINDLYHPNVSIFNQTQMSQLSFDEMQSLVEIFDLYNTHINLNTFTDDLRQKLVHPFEDVLWYCEFNGRECTAERDFVWRWDPIYGNCYSFNTGFNATGHNVDYKESLLPGAIFGLLLNVYVGYIDKLNAFNVGWFTTYGTNAPFYGLNILIENNTYLSNDKSNVIALNGGTANYISMQRKFTSKLPKPYSACDIDNTNPSSDSTYFNLVSHTPYQYNQELCVIQCMQEKVIHICNCSIPFLLDLYNVSCENEGEVLCAYNALWDDIIPIEATIRECISKCPLECNSTQFTFTLTSQAYSGILFEALVKSNKVYSNDFTQTPITEETTSNKFVQVILYYDSLTYTQSTDTPSMDIMALLGNIGGTLGLFLGVSVLSLCELMNLLVECFIFIKKKRSQVN
jgi:hypothetical protein